MEKYLVFRLEKWHRVNVAKQPKDGGVVLGVYVQPVYEDRKFPCFELVEEFHIEYDVDWIMDRDREEVVKFAKQYSKDNKVRTVVVKGSVFGD